ncbi:MAG TPA: hypothetical protein VF242_03170 [Nitrososphaeraceae archaeon]
MSKLTVTTKDNILSLILATVLVAGTIALSSLSFMTADAQSESYYGMDKDRKDVNSKSIKCNNVNVNINGLELNVLPPTLANVLAQDDEGEISVGSYGSYGDGQSSYDNKNSFKFVCINNNNNTVVVGEEPPVPPVPPVVNECAEDIEACFEEFFSSELFELLTEALESSAGLTVEINGEEVTLRSFEDICDALEGLTFEQLADAVFNIITEVAPQPIIIIGSELFNCIAEALDIPIPR